MTQKEIRFLLKSIILALNSCKHGKCLCIEEIKTDILKALMDIHVDGIKNESDD